MRVTEKTYTPFKKQYDVCCALDTKVTAHIISQIRRFADSQIRRFGRSLANASLSGFRKAKTSSGKSVQIFKSSKTVYLFSYNRPIGRVFSRATGLFRFERIYKSFFTSAISSCTGGKID